MWPTLLYHSDSSTWLNVSNDTPEVCQMSYFSSAVCHWRDGMKTHFFVSYDTFKILCVVFVLNDKSEYKVLSAKMFAIKLVIE